MAKRVLVTEYIHPAGLDLLKTECELLHPPDISVDTMKRAIADVDAALVRLAPMSREVIQAGRGLKVIAKHGVGTDSIDIPAATEHGVAVCNTPEANSEAVASLVLGLMLALSRRVVECDAFVRAGGWSDKDSLMGHELFGSTLSVVGLGRIGALLAEKCRAAFGMRVFAYDPYVSQDAMAAMGITRVETVDELMPVADYISLHTPLTPATRGIVGRRQLDLMKPTSYLINAARGPVVDEAALIDALRQGRIAGAALDVFESEPPDLNNPLLQMKNVVLLPHMGGATHQSMEKMAIHSASEILSVLRGDRPRYLLNPEVLDRSGERGA